MNDKIDIGNVRGIKGDKGITLGDTMKLHFAIKQQQLKRIDDKILASYSKNFIRCSFKCSKEWIDIYKYALFCDVSNKKYIVDLGYGEKVKCRIPCDILKGNYFLVSVFGDDRLTTTQETILIEPSGFSDAVEEAFESSDEDDLSMISVSGDMVDEDKPKLVNCYHGYTILKNPNHDEHLYL